MRLLQDDAESPLSVRALLHGEQAYSSSTRTIHGASIDCEYRARTLQCVQVPSVDWRGPFKGIL